MKAARAQRIQRFLGALAEQRQSEPPEHLLVLKARNYLHERDRELVAFLASLLEGQKPVERTSEVLDKLLERLGKQPGRSLARSSHELIAEATHDLELGFLGPREFRCLLSALRNLIRRHRNLELAYLDSLGEGRGRDPLVALDRFMLHLIQGVPKEERAHPGVAHLLPRPAKGSAVARLHRFLRCMVRPDDGLDLGLWKRPSPAALLIPLDGPILERARWLKLSERERANRGSVLELSQTLRQLNPVDPMIYSHGFDQMIELGWDVDAMRQQFRHA